MQTHPVVKDLVLIGGGHAHLTVLKRFGMRPLPGVRLTLVSRTSQSPYSGMLPGHIAGHYSADEMHFDLRALADFAGARFVRAEVVGLDVRAQRILCHGRPALEYDMLSLNVGSTPSQADLAVTSARVTPVKPIDEFASRWQALQARVQTATRPLRIGVIGGGAGGVELVLAIHHRLTDGRAAHDGVTLPHEFHLFTATDEVLPSHNARTRRAFAALLRARGITCHVDARVVRVDEEAIHTADDRHFPLDEVLWVTTAAPAPWLGGSGLAVDAMGCVRVGADLQSVSHAGVFAVGDCAAIDGTPRPKSGVYAVRQGPPLADNLRRLCRGEPLRHYRAQREALSLISTGPKAAIASRGAWSFGAGIGAPWVWRWKDWIDRRFMQRFQALPVMTGRDETPPPAFAAEVADLGPLAMRCGGCGAKVGAQVIATALDELAPGTRPDVPVGLGGRDDAAIVAVPAGHLAVHTIDGFRTFIGDPYVFGQVTAAHCLSDVFAMGATPQSALAYVTLPLATNALLRRELSQLLAGASEILRREDTALVGGHTSEGAELALAFAINGHIAPAAVRAKDTPQAGDVLILTKPLGTGVIFAGAMQRKAHPRWVDDAVESMIATNGPAARALVGFTVHALTDVTGFGLAGHLAEVLRRGTLRAELRLADLPLLEGAEALAAVGVRSTLHRQNAVLDPAIDVGGAAADSARHALLFDPQTSGGLLIAVAAEDAAGCVTALQRSGAPRAAVIGRLH